MLIRINSKYDFCCEQIYYLKHTYDNTIFYNEVSCLDYLIYDLQYNSKKVLSQIANVYRNKDEYDKYYNEISSLELGSYDKKTKGLIKFFLDKKEIKLMNKIRKKPQVIYKIDVLLSLSTINGHIYHQKRNSFSDVDICSIIDRLKNKTGKFYNDPEIWNSICRVERAKVSNKMRFSIYKRDGYRCKYCGKTDRYTSLEIDHIIPIAKGGKSKYDNLQTLCRSCNKNKGDKIL